METYADTASPLVLPYRGSPDLHRGGDVVSPGMTPEVVDFLNKTEGGIVRLTTAGLKDGPTSLEISTARGHRYIHVPDYNGRIQFIGDLRTKNRARDALSQRQIDLANAISAAVSNWLKERAGEPIQGFESVLFTYPGVDTSTEHITVAGINDRPKISTLDKADNERGFWKREVEMASTAGLGSLINEEPLTASTEKDYPFLKVTIRLGNRLCITRTSLTQEAWATWKRLTSYRNFPATIHSY